MCQNQSMSLARCTFQLEVDEVELSEESEEKEMVDEVDIICNMLIKNILTYLYN